MGTVTFLFTDVEGSTRLLHELGAEAYAEALAEHRRVIREACAAEGGVEVDTQGDAFFFAFPTAPGALAAAEAMTDALGEGQIQVRIGLHTGTPLLTDEGYVGDDIHRAARIAAAGHGGQMLVSASTALLVDVGLRDLGEHRFKDLSAAERVYQLGDSEFPPLKSLYRTNLPVPATPFLGRERELARVVELLASTRLLTLTGPGGTGKTRLALHAAGMASDAYPDGLYWVPLASLSDPDLVLVSAAQALEASDGVAEHVGDKRMLLLFDNFEQVMAAAGGVADLLGSCPQLAVLVTSRQPLRLTAEQEYPVPSFAHEESVSFFLGRARAVKPDFEVGEAVSEICRRLDDLPLALELAAARVKALSPAQLLQRLEQRLPLLTGGAQDLPERQRTLRATIAWSYELLNGDEQRLFSRLAIFAGGCTLEAAEEVTETDLDSLQSLVDKSLLGFSDDRYSMLETIREFAQECLEESGEADACFERLARHLVDLANAEGAPNFLGRQPAAMARLEPEQPNIRSVIAWALRKGRDDIVMELIGRLWLFWADRGYEIEAFGWVDEAFTHSEGMPDDVLLPALVGAGEIARGTGHLTRSISFKEELIERARGSDVAEPWWEAAALVDLADIAIAQGDLVKAQALAERGLELRKGQGPAEARALGSLADIAYRRGDLDHADDLAGAAADGWREVGHESNLAGALYVSGEIALARGDVDRAAAFFGESLERFIELGTTAGAGQCLLGLAVVAHTREQFERAGRLWGAGETIVEAAGGWRPSSLLTIGDVPKAARAEGAAMSLDEAVTFALENRDA